MIYLVIVPLDLAPDEAYYWDWSRVPDWGYYSKPPMVAWLMAASTFLGGNTAFFVRLPSVILSATALLAVYLLARSMYGERAGFYAGLSSLAIPGNSVLSLVMTIDAPLVCFWALSSLSLWMAVNAGATPCGCPNVGATRRLSLPVWWIMVGVFTGLGLLSKQTMSVFPVLALLFVLTSPDARKTLKTPWPYVSFFIALLMLSPFLYWNLGHNWITFVHTAHHFDPHETKKLVSLTSFFDLLGSQAGIISPLLWLLLMASGLFYLVFWATTRGYPYKDVRFLAFFGIIPIMGIFLLSLRQNMNANWPAPFYEASIIMLSGIYTGKVSLGNVRVISAIKCLYRPALILGLAMTVLLYLLPWSLSILKLDGGSLDPTKRLKGWKEVGLEAGKLYNGLPGKEKTFILATKRQIVSELAFYMPFQPRVYHWAVSPKRIKSQYEIWPGPWDKKGWDSLIFMPDENPLPKGIYDCFESVSLLRTISIPSGEKGKRVIQVYHGIGLKDRPQ
jgi:4-amino-4-deoxy-L-arabinose transferase-like glycosyltransferase